ncbi:MAG: DUF2721 domain-containing protein [Bryobacterales bacterium]|nr:DUF2721 domain-containing protein [Bryobacterales bacterium]
MAPMTDSPFAVLTTVVAPAILTNACSVLALGTSNRIARVVDRVRVISDRIMALPADDPECLYWEKQLVGLRQRARSLFWALRLIYAALGAFASAALIAIVGSALAVTGMEPVFQASAIAGLIVGTAGVAGLAVGCVLMVTEVRLALSQTQEEAEFASAHHSVSGIGRTSPAAQPMPPPPAGGGVL